MDTVTRTFPVNLTSSYTPNSIIELCHFRDMTFDDDERVAVYLESFFCNLNLKSFNRGIISEFDGSESEAEKMALFSAAEAKSQKVGLRILTRKNNTGDWQEKAEIILVNRGRKDYFDLLQPYLAKNQVRIFEKNDALAIQLVDYGNGLLKPIDSLGIEAAFTITIAKKNDREALQARISALELALEGKLTNLPSNSLLGRNTNTGVVEIINQSKFATAAMLDQVIVDLVGGAPGALNTLKELASALNNDASFADSIASQLALKSPLANPAFTGLIGNGGGQIQFPAVQNPSSNSNTLDDYGERTFVPVVIGMTTAGTATYSIQTGRFTKIGNRVIFDVFVEWTGHTGTGELRLTGLPHLFASSPVSAVSIWHRQLNFTAGNTLIGYIAGFSGGVGQIVISQVPTGGGGQTPVPLDSAAGLMISGSYSVMF